MLIGPTSERGQVATSSQTGRSGAAEIATPTHTGQGTTSPAVPFINPAINFDYQSGIAVLVVRNTQTGQIENQYPSKKVVEEYRRHGASTQDAATGATPVAADSAPSPAPAAQPQAVAAATSAPTAPGATSNPGK